MRKKRTRKETIRLEHTKVPELLAPAGDRERLDAALLYGADAVYLGGQEFGMRAAPSNFSEEGLVEAVRDCHEKGVRVHLTVNTLPRNEEIDALPQFLSSAKDAGVDAFIIADVGVMKLAQKYAPGVDIHMSTQAGVVNYLTANTLYDMGAKRVVMARECSLEEIAEVRAKTPKDLEIEAFVHGAMCMSVSGRCLLSNYMTGRDGNRGECAQPCRWQYHLMEEKRPGEREWQGKTYKKIIDTSVGRLLFNAAIDGYLKHPAADYVPEPWILDEVRKISYRDYCTGFYFGAPEKDAHIYYDGIYIRNWDVIANVLSSDGEFVTVTQRNRFFKGDVLEVMSPGTPPFELTVTEMFNEAGEEVDVAPNPMATIRIRSDLQIPTGSVLRMQKQN